MSRERRRRETAASFRALIEEIRAAASGPVAVALDHELGGIQRCEGLVGALPSTDEALRMTSEALEARCREVAADLHALGVDVVLAPVLDMGSDSPWLRGRLLDGTAEEVARVGAAFVRGFEAAGVATTPKHFPGHRAIASDPMVDADAVVPLDLQQLLADLVPFRTAVAAGARCAMVGPGLFPALDPSDSAVCSAEVVELLRTGCGFAGVVVSDDVDAPSVMRGRPLPQAVLDAVAAGNDLVLLAAGGDLEQAAAALAAAAASGALPAERLRSAAARVRALARSAAA